MPGPALPVEEDQARPAARDPGPPLIRLLSACNARPEVHGPTPGAGLYIYPDIDANRAANFIVSLQSIPDFRGVAATVNDLLVFYDIDGSGEEGMAITRSNHLVNNNTSTLYDVGDLVEVPFERGVLFLERNLGTATGNASVGTGGLCGEGAGQGAGEYP